MFVDASAIVAILLQEPGYGSLAERLRVCPPPSTSGIAIYEAVLAVARQRAPFDEAEAAVWDFVAFAGIEIVPITEGETRAALTAFMRYGKGRHPARLNLGDCFAYACARTGCVPLLFVGGDFTHTDIPSALG